VPPAKKPHHSTKDHPISWEKEKLQMELQNAQKQREHDLCMKKMESCMPLKIKKVWPEFAMKVFLIETLFRVLTGHF